VSDPSLWVQVAVMLLTAGSIYGAIRSDIKSIHRRIDEQREDYRDRLDSVKMGLAEESRRIDELFKDR